MNLSQLSQQELVELIQKASAELASRLAQPEIERIKHPRPVIAMREPPEEDKDFVLAMKHLLSKGRYAKAAERERVAEIAREYPEWVAQQRMPKSSSAGEWRRVSEFYALGRAKER